MTDLTECAEGDNNAFVLLYDIGGGGSAEENEPETVTCESGIVKVYDCDTQTTTNCCPDGGNDCSQPTCTCEQGCPGDQVCEDNVYVCPDNGTFSRTVPGVCCLDGKAWDESDCSYTADNEACQ